MGMVLSWVGLLGCLNNWLDLEVMVILIITMHRSAIYLLQDDYDLEEYENKLTNELKAIPKVDRNVA